MRELCLTDQQVAPHVGYLVTVLSEARELLYRGTVAHVRAGSAILIPVGELDRLQDGHAEPYKSSIEACEKMRAVLTSYVDIPSAGSLLNLAPVAVRARITRGKLHAIKVGSRTMIPLSEIERVRYERWPDGKKPKGK
jgi:hypothetical protein